MKLHHAIILGLTLLGTVPAAQAAAQATPVEKNAAAPADGKVHLNQASVEQLQRLKGVGPSTARAIVAWRKESGPFKSVDQLLAVKGIGAKTLAKMRDQLAL